MPPASEIEIRRASPEQAEAIAAVLREAFLQFRPLYTDGGFAATTPEAQHILARISEGPVWVAFRRGIIVGTGSAVAKNASVYIRGMAVLPAARGLGVGSELLREIEAWAIRHGCTRLFLSTTPFLASAIRLYESSGFRRTDEGPHDLFGTPLFTMQKIVGNK